MLDPISLRRKIVKSKHVYTGVNLGQPSVRLTADERAQGHFFPVKLLRVLIFRAMDDESE